LFLSCIGARIPSIDANISPRRIERSYANQGARNSAILPFTSALSAFCAATTAATVELPFLDTISSLYGVDGEGAVVPTFPILSSAFAAAAAVSKARCEVDAEAAAQAASTLALEHDDMNGSGGRSGAAAIPGGERIGEAGRDKRLEGHKEGGRQSVR